MNTRAACSWFFALLGSACAGSAPLPRAPRSIAPRPAASAPSSFSPAPASAGREPSETSTRPAYDATWFPYVAPALAERKGTALDASVLLDAPAGKHGTIRRRGERLVFADGTEARFWGVTLEGDASYPTQAQAEVMAEWCASLGINLVRHELRAAELMEGERFERFDDLNAELARRGVYVALAVEASAPERFLSEFLRHRSSRSGKTYAVEPGLVMVSVRGAPASTHATASLEERSKLEAELFLRLRHEARISGYRGLLTSEVEPLSQPVRAYVAALTDWIEEGTDDVAHAFRHRVAGSAYVARYSPPPSLWLPIGEYVRLAAYAGLHDASAVLPALSSAPFAEPEQASCRLSGTRELRCQPALVALWPALSRLVHAKHVKPSAVGFYQPVGDGELFAAEPSPPPPALSFVAKTGLEFVGSKVKAPAWDEVLSRFAGATSATSVTGELFSDWEQGTFELDTPRSQAVARPRPGARRAVSNLALTLETEGAVVLATALDGRVIARSERILLTAVGRAANQGSLLDGSGLAWAEEGTGPVLVQPVRGRVALAGLVGETSEIAVYTLDFAGRRSGAVSIGTGPGVIDFELDPRALHYEVVRSSE